MQSTTGGNCTVYSSDSPRPPMAETESFKTLEWAVSLLQHSNSDVASEAAYIVSLYSIKEGSTMARCSIAQGIAEAKTRILNALANGDTRNA
jgi:hypothetical protein